MLVGDAAGHCSPISGEGIHYSMMGGISAAETAAHCIRKSEFHDGMLSRYERSWTKQIGSDLKWGYWLQRRLMKPSTSTSTSSGWSSSGFIDSDKSLRIIAEMLMGDRSVKRSILAIAPGYLKGKISR
jgi:flavin-dependent dehydrogenase